MDTTYVLSFGPDFFTAVQGPRWVNAEHTLIECQVNFKHVSFEEWTPFCADPNDYMPYSKEIFDRCVAGEFGEVAEYVPPYVEEVLPVIGIPTRIRESNATPIPVVTL